MKNDLVLRTYLEDYGRICRAIGRLFPSSDSDQASILAEEILPIIMKKTASMIEDHIGFHQKGG